MKNLIVSLVALLKSLSSYRLYATYKVTYAPEDSRKPHLPVQVYHIIGHPEHLAWKSKAGNRLFTARFANDKMHIASFRSDRVLSVNFAGVTFLTQPPTKLAGV
jgi:hypothetical protein